MEGMPGPIRIPVASSQGCILASHPNALNHCCRLQGSKIARKSKKPYSCSTVKVGPEKIRFTDSACAGGNVSSVQEPHLHLEVGHILFLDIVGYSKLPAPNPRPRGGSHRHRRGHLVFLRSGRTRSGCGRTRPARAGFRASSVGVFAPCFQGPLCRVTASGGRLSKPAKYI